MVDGVHDCSDGGLAVALAEMAIAGGVRASRVARDRADPALAWFSESASRVVLAVDPGAGRRGPRPGAPAAGVPASRLGVAGGDRLVADGAFDVALADATDAWRDAIPRAARPGPTSDAA